ncbi:DUF2381 family protein (plasmid) [Myxococcus sp. MxC21-1]|uniref:DUF2381 family protein n=1 Tax=Myxococcus sp. MxC21-1 TaxID=3041439 RepID=UPI0029316FE2|nr:DUF2381 family protein [Myxococcus sp. MxC21-1]WNZ66249.1 DUF2381 family protein [Myxococcus sp. MxC21-1]
MITDDNAETLHELRVAAGVATTLVLSNNSLSASGGAILAAPPDVMPAPHVLNENRTLILTPQRDLARGEAVPLTLTFADKSVQSFRLVTSPDEVDVQVSIDLALRKRATAVSAAALDEKANNLQAALDECRSTAAEAGIRQVAALITRQDFERPVAYTAERLSVRHLDKQSRLHVQVRASYRLFNQSYVVLTVENRHPAKLWQIERAEVGVAGGGGAAEAKVHAVESEIPELPPGETTKVTIAFSTPAQTKGQRYILRLFERGGSRHVALEDVEL